MDRQKAEKILEIYGRPVLINRETGKGIAIARQDIKDVDEIEKMTDSELVEQWKSLVWTNEIYGQVDLNDMQRINLLEQEMDTRKGINVDEVSAWFAKAQDEYDKVSEKWQ